MNNVKNILKALTEKRNESLLHFCNSGEFLLTEEKRQDIDMQIRWLEGCPSNNSEDEKGLKVKIIF